MGVIDLLNQLRVNVNSRIVVKTGFGSISKEDEADNFYDIIDIIIALIPNGIISGLVTSISGSNAIVTKGEWKINGQTYQNFFDVTIPLDAQDPVLKRFDVIYADANSNIGMISGQLSDTPVQPNIPANSLAVAIILVTPTDITISVPPTQEFVDTISNQNVDGFKNFLKSPQVPTAIGDDDAVPLKQLTDLVDFDEIVDDEPDFNPTVDNFDFVLNFINGGDNNIPYTDQNGDAQVLTPGSTFTFGYLNSDQESTPNFGLNANTLFALQSPAVAQGDFEYQNATDFAAVLAAMNATAASDYIIANGPDINIYNKNLIVAVPDDNVRAELTQLQIYNVTDSALVYDGLVDASSPLLHLGSELNSAKHYQVRVQSTDPDLVIAVNAHNVSGTLIKNQNFLVGDGDNSFVSPITVLIFKSPAP